MPRRRSALLRTRPSRHPSSCRLLCRSHSARGEAERSPGAVSDEIRDGREPQDRQGARPNGAAIHFAARRRGDRVGGVAQLRHQQKTPWCASGPPAPQGSIVPQSARGARAVAETGGGKATWRPLCWGGPGAPGIAQERQGTPGPPRSPRPLSGLYRRFWRPSAPCRPSRTVSLK
jgi:hypothetical protein